MIRHDEEENQKCALWESQRTGRQKDVLNGTIPFQTLATELGQEILPAFRIKDRIVRCMDERTPGGLRIAGSGILQDHQKLAAYLRANDIEVDGVTSHKGCGAAGLAAVERGLPQDTPSVDKLADVDAQQFAHVLGVPYQGQLDVAPAFHIAQAGYYTDTDFDPSNVAALPTGFVISRHCYEDVTEAQRAAGLMPRIACGTHGFGDFFTAKEPFMLVAIGLNAASHDQLVDELHQMVTTLPELMQQRVRIDSLLKPA